MECESPVVCALRNRWSSRFPAVLFDEAFSHWESPGRHYHGPSHLLEVLSLLDEKLPAGNPWGTEMILAAWFHDSVMTFGNNPHGDDERLSASIAMDFCRRIASLGGPSADQSLVEAAILATSSHGSPPALPGSQAAAAGVFLCCDLAILASPDEKYDAYASGVRLEHCRFDDAAYAAGRSSFLSSSLERGRVFPVDGLFSNERALANMSRELGFLRTAASTPTPRCC